MTTLLADLRYALRQLRRAPGFAVTAILTLALGIGAATAVYSVAYGVLIDPFPYRDVHTLVSPSVCGQDASLCYPRIYTPAQFNEVARTPGIFNGVTASTVGEVTLTGGHAPQQIRGNYITPNTFTVLGVQPMLGRPSTESDVRSGHGEVALLSYRYWQQHYGGSPSVLGTVVMVDRRARTVIGVMPPRFLWRGADIYLPIDMTSSDVIEGQRYFTLVGRVRAGVTSVQAAAVLKPVFVQLHTVNPTMFPANPRIGLMPFDEMFQSGLGGTLHLLLLAVFVLLLIACANVSSLLLARAVGREREFAVRASLGGSAWRLARAALTESLVLVLFALPVALGFAYVALQAILRIVPPETIPDEAVVSMSLPVLLGSLAVAAVTILIFGTAPAWRSATPRLTAAMQGGLRASAGRSQQRLLGGFVVTEIALSLALLVLAGLMIRSLIAVESVPISMDPDHTLIVGIPLAADHYPDAESQNRFFRQFLDRVRQLPSVRAITLDAGLPLIDINAVHAQLAGQPMDRRLSLLRLTDPAYLQVASRTVLAGHFIDQREIDARSHDIVVSQAFARRYLGSTVLGRVIQLPDLQPEGKPLADVAFTVVGLVKDVPEFATHRESYPEIFLPYTVAPQSTGVALISTALPPESLVESVRRLVNSIDKEQPVANVMSLRQLLNMYGYAGPRFALTLFGAFAVAALLLALVGIYGVLSFVTTQRTKEIGIRIALGARPWHVMRMVFRQACVLAGLGVAFGLPLALVAGRFASDELVRTSPRDPLVLFAAACLLPLLALTGTLLPARRAANIDPIEALRSE